MRKIYSGSSQFVLGAADKTLHTGPGKVYAILATGSSATPVEIALFDNPVATYPLLAAWSVAADAPLIIILPQSTPITFTNGLTARAGSGVRAFIITEAEA